jgi:hypothetical protein
MKSYEEFCQWIWDKPKNIPKHWRLGQYVFNVVEAKYGSVAREVQFQDGIDCFFDDTKIEDFLKAVYKRLTESEEDGRE